jgi:hypothetical protein
MSCFPLIIFSLSLAEHESSRNVACADYEHYHILTFRVPNCIHAEVFNSKAEM